MLAASIKVSRNNTYTDSIILFYYKPSDHINFLETVIDNQNQYKTTDYNSEETLSQYKGIGGQYGTTITTHLS